MRNYHNVKNVGLLSLYPIGSWARSILEVRRPIAWSNGRYIYKSDDTFVARRVPKVHKELIIL